MMLVTNFYTPPPRRYEPGSLIRLYAGIIGVCSAKPEYLQYSETIPVKPGTVFRRLGV
jgi:hypothetical protein